MKTRYKNSFFLFLVIIISSGFLYGCATTAVVKTSVNSDINKQNLSLLIKRDKSIPAFTDAIINPKSVIRIKFHKIDALFFRLYNYKRLLSQREIEQAETGGLSLPGYNKLHRRFLTSYKAYCNNMGGRFKIRGISIQLPMSSSYAIIDGGSSYLLTDNNDILNHLVVLFAKKLADKYPRLLPFDNAWIDYSYRCVDAKNQDLFAIFFVESLYVDHLNHFVDVIISYDYNSYIKRMGYKIAKKNAEYARLEKERAAERLKDKIIREKNTVWFYSGLLSVNGLNMKAKLIPMSAYKDYSHIHIELYFKNNKNIPSAINLTKTKTLFIPQSGVTYGITWYQLSNGFINVNKYGSGCALTNRNTELLINPGADCFISMPVRVPGFNPSINTTPGLAFGDNITVRLNPMNKYNYNKIYNLN